jgi:hypothetical protein
MANDAWKARVDPNHDEGRGLEQKNKNRRKYTRADGLNPEHMVQYGTGYFEGAQELFGTSDPQLFFSAGYLGHLSIELYLKAWQLHHFDEFDAMNSLNHLWMRLEKAGILGPMTERDDILIRTFDEFEQFGYPHIDRASQNFTGFASDLSELRDTLMRWMPYELRFFQWPADGKIRIGGQVLTMIGPDGRPHPLYHPECDDPQD